ncbi:MAG: hypothetical protein JWN75_493 [Candidatus Saccharibacteria bacterium]|nr:hypothetical protein [Candidatus Saccharibacteria bacterium]
MNKPWYTDYMISHETPKSIDQSDPDEQIKKEKPQEDRKMSGALAAQQAIIATEVYWQGGLRDFSDSSDDPRESRYLEP